MAWYPHDYSRKDRKAAAKHQRGNNRSALVKALEEMEAPDISDEDLIEEIEILEEMTGMELSAKEKIAIINGEWRTK